MGKLYTVYAYSAKNALLTHKCFIRRYRSDPAMYSTVPEPQMLPSTLCSILNGFKLLLQRNIVV